jgi:hypothetical protein
MKRDTSLPAPGLARRLVSQRQDLLANTVKHNNKLRTTPSHAYYGVRLVPPLIQRWNARHMLLRRSGMGHRKESVASATRRVSAASACIATLLTADMIRSEIKHAGVLKDSFRRPNRNATGSRRVRHLEEKPLTASHSMASSHSWLKALEPTTPNSWLDIQCATHVAPMKIL